MNLAGRCFEEGWGCVRSSERAAFWYRRSTEAGYLRGQFNHGPVLIEQGERVAGLGWLEQAAAGGNEEIRRAVAAVREGRTVGNRCGGGPDGAPG
jgi:TPR repeat protein